MRSTQGAMDREKGTPPPELKPDVVLQLPLRRPRTRWPDDGYVTSVVRSWDDAELVARRSRVPLVVAPRTPKRCRDPPRLQSWPMKPWPERRKIYKRPGPLSPGPGRWRRFRHQRHERRAPLFGIHDAVACRLPCRCPSLFRIRPSVAADRRLVHRSDGCGRGRATRTIPPEDRPRVRERRRRHEGVGHAPRCMAVLGVRSAFGQGSGAVATERFRLRASSKRAMSSLFHERLLRSAGRVSSACDQRECTRRCRPPDTGPGHRLLSNYSDIGARHFDPTP